MPVKRSHRIAHGLLAAGVLLAIAPAASAASGELVLDPFLGSGSTLVAAQDLNRNAAGFDLKPEYVELSHSRLASPSLGLNR